MSPPAPVGRRRAAAVADGVAVKPARKPRADKPQGLRALFAQIADEEATVDQIRQIVMDALQAEDATKVACPECGCEFRAPLPDVKKQLDAAIDLLEQIEGRPEQRQPEAMTITIQRPPLQ